MAKLRKGLKAALTFSDKPQILIKDGEYEYRLYILEDGQKMTWNDGRYYSVGPGLFELEFSAGSMKTNEFYLSDPKGWVHVQRLMSEGYELLKD